MFLSSTELVALTHKKQRSAQVRALRAMGVDHLVRPDGSPAVLEQTLKNLTGNLANDKFPHVEPDWSAC